MHLVLIALAMGVFLHDAPAFDDYAVTLPVGGLLATVLLPKLLLGGGYWLACRRGYRKLRAPGGLRAIKQLNVFTALLPIAAMASYMTDLWVGALRSIRGGASSGISGPRDWVLFDEVAVMLPTLALLVWSWWAYYPIDRRMREATIFRQADMGLPIYPVWTRSEYVLTQARNQFAMILGPLLAIMAWSECLVKLGEAERISETQQLWLTPVGAAGVFLLAPLLIRRLWDTVPLPPGEVRDKLNAMCERHGVKVRELLLWRTFGGTINAAVMGMFGRLRFILLSDGLLDQVSEREVEAVMAHELAHVRLKHLWWLLVSAASGMALLSTVGEQVASFDVAWPSWALPAAFAVGLGLWALMFGWVSRRIERQADTFAARHMAEVYAEHAAAAPPTAASDAANPLAYASPPNPASSADSVNPNPTPVAPIAPVTPAAAADPQTPKYFTTQAVNTMIGALQRVADLNHIVTTRRSWRHGSIAWRQAHLHSLVGLPLEQPPIDALMRRVNLASLLILFVAVAVSIIAG